MIQNDLLRRLVGSAMESLEAVKDPEQGLHLTAADFASVSENNIVLANSTEQLAALWSRDFLGSSSEISTGAVAENT